MPDLNPGGNNTEYKFVNGKYILRIGMREYSNTSSRLDFYISDDVDLSTKTYNLSDVNFLGSYTSTTLNNFITDSQNTGTITITKFDKINKIVSGTFNFKAKNQNGEIVIISDGRFDKKFLN